MKPVLQIIEENCVGCNQCILSCPVEFANTAYSREGKNKIYLNLERCIICGNCLSVCEHEARFYLDDTEAFISSLQKGEAFSIITNEKLSKNQPVYNKIVSTFKALGVHHVYNERWGKEIYRWSFRELLEPNDTLKPISLEYPEVVRYLQKYTPERLSELVPVQAPLICLVTYLRQYMKNKDKIVFLIKGIEQVPVLGKNQIEDVYYVVLPRLINYLKEQGIELSDEADEDYPFDALEGSDIYQENTGSTNRCDTQAREPESVKTDLWTSPQLKTNWIDERMQASIIRKHIQKRTAPKVLQFAKYLDVSDFAATYVPEPLPDLLDPTSAEYDAIFADLHKTTETSRKINCNACGYRNCYRMAKAIFYGYNQKENCSRYNAYLAYEKLVYVQRTDETLELLEEVFIKSKLVEANEKLKELDKVKTDFLSTVSHELRTPLTSVLGFANLIKKKLEEVIFPQIQVEDRKVQRTIAQIRENVNIIITEGVRLTDLINDVLDIAKMEAGKTEWKVENLSVTEIIDRSMAATTSLFKQKELVLVKEVGKDTPEILGDKDRLIQVMINLLSNAVKFTETGTVTCRATREGNGVKVSVVDSGIGIEEKELTAVFEKFKQVGDTLTDKPKGTGLGLPICKQIIEHLGGRIWAESTKGVGSTFSFTIPVVQGKREQEYMRVEQSMVRQLKDHLVTVAPLKTGDKKVLVVDDESSIRELLKQEFEDEGYVVDEAKDGIEALEKIKANKPDIIILDVMMPVMNGLDVAAIIKNDPETKEIPIIILSILEDIERGLHVGVDKYLNKPIDVDNLKKEVKVLVDHGKTKKNVLIINEEDPTLNTLVSALQAKGFTVTETRDYQWDMGNVAAEIPNILIINAKLADRYEVSRTVKYNNDAEEVLVVIYGGMATQGFSKLGADKALSKMDRSCAQECKCSAMCQLFMAREFLSLSAQTGEKFNDNCPEDILDIFRSMPFVSERYKNKELQEAFCEVQSICDNCATDEHDSFCTVNIVLTALGILIHDKDYITGKDMVLAAN